MSFMVQYRRLFSVSAQDEAGAALAAFSFAPAVRTLGLLSNHQLTFRPRPTGFEIFYRTNPQAVDPLVGRIGGRIRLTFPFTLTETDFFERFQPDLTPASGPQLYLDNLTPAGVIQAAATLTLSTGAVAQTADAMKVYPRRFLATAELGGAGPPTKFTVRGKFTPGDVILEVPMVAAAGAGQAAVRIDLSGRPAGPYTLGTDAAGATPRTIYVDDDLAGVPMLGLVDVHWETAQGSPPTGAAYVIRFRKR
jgi:hypothetical protein